MNTCQQAALNFTGGGNQGKINEDHKLLKFSYDDDFFAIINTVVPPSSIQYSFACCSFFIAYGCDDGDLERRLEDAYDAELLELAMARVKKRVKPVTFQAFQLTVIDGSSGADAAQKLEIPVAHVFVAKHRVQKMLQDEVHALRKARK
jgi:hypothetical protein